MFDYLKENKLGVGILAIGAILTGLAFAVQGCALDDLIQVKVPQGVQASVGVAPKVPLSEAPYTFEAYRTKVERDSRQFSESISDAQFLHSTVAGLVRMGFEEASGPLSLMPYGSLLLAGLTGFGGVMLKKPGTDKATAAMREEHQKTLAHEKEKSYNAGITKGTGA